MISEIKLVTMGVLDLDRSIAFYADAFGFEEISRTRVDHEAVSEAWRIPQGVDGRFAVVGLPGVESGMLRLVEWTPSGNHVWASPARPFDLGTRFVSLRVKEIHSAWELLGQLGAREKRAPAFREFESDIALWDSRCLDPDGTLLAVFQVVGEIERTLGPFAHGQNATEVQAVSIGCSDVGRSAAFYAALGYETLYDREIDDAGPFLELPAGTRLHNIDLIRNGDRPTGRIELTQCIGLEGRSLKARTAAPGRGPLMMSMRVKSLDEARGLLESLGGKAIAKARYDCPPFGNVAAATFFGPDGEVIELFEVL